MRVAKVANSVADGYLVMMELHVQHVLKRIVSSKIPINSAKSSNVPIEHHFIADIRNIVLSIRSSHGDPK